MPTFCQTEPLAFRFSLTECGQVVDVGEHCGKTYLEFYEAQMLVIAPGLSADIHTYSWSVERITRQNVLNPKIPGPSGPQPHS